jgi:hypothetical protein
MHNYTVLYSTFIEIYGRLFYLETISVSLFFYTRVMLCFIIASTSVISYAYLPLRVFSSSSSLYYYVL